MWKHVPQSPHGDCGFVPIFLAFSSISALYRRSFHFPFHLLQPWKIPSPLLLSQFAQPRQTFQLISCVREVQVWRTWTDIVEGQGHKIIFFLGTWYFS